MLLPFALLTLAGYVCGATPFGYLAGRLKGIDIRQHGSGNIGATNVIRTLGKGIGIPVFILDVLEGWFPAWLAQHWMSDQAAEPRLDHQRRYRSRGRSSARAQFYFLAEGQGRQRHRHIRRRTPRHGSHRCRHWPVNLCHLSQNLPLRVAVFLDRRSRDPDRDGGDDARSGQWNFILLGFGVALCVLAIVRHKANIQRLIAGTEPKVGQRSHNPQLSRQALSRAMFCSLMEVVAEVFSAQCSVRSFGTSTFSALRPSPFALRLFFLS